MGKGSAVLHQLQAEIRKAERRGISRYRLAQVSGVTEATISRLMAGKLPSPRIDTLEKLAEALELRLVLAKPK